jgi:hypothetical protein
MTPETLIKFVFGAHSTILASAVYAFLNFSTYSNKFRNWQNDIGEALDNLKRTLPTSLSKVLNPIIQRSGTTTKNILDSSGNYCEVDVDPTDGEGYLNALSNFINENANEMARYRTLLLTYRAYSFWATYLSWTIMILGALEITLLALIGYFGILKGKNISDLLITVSFSISAIGIIICFFGLLFLLINYNKGIKNRGCND